MVQSQVLSALHQQVVVEVVVEVLHKVLQIDQVIQVVRVVVWVEDVYQLLVGEQVIPLLLVLLKETTVVMDLLL
tara:strand:- start:357 stop:578 length:222 start_codon:yes stop_codon:yes gene_type:complete